jgi:uncharacterized protein
MIDLSQIAGFQWDEGNGHKSLDKHGVTQSEAEQVFVNEPLLLMEDSVHSHEEQRYHAFGRSHAGRYLQVSFTMRDNGTLLRVISTRPMSARERLRYDQEA